jgi:hypothetical protein
LASQIGLDNSGNSHLRPDRAFVAVGQVKSLKAQFGGSPPGPTTQSDANRRFPVSDEQPAICGRFRGSNTGLAVLAYEVFCKIADVFDYLGNGIDHSTITGMGAVVGAPLRAPRNMPNTEASFAELKARLAKTIDYCKPSSRHRSTAPRTGHQHQARRQ